MEFLKYIIGAVALGITESLPISGTGHTLLMEHIFGQGENFRMVLSFLYIGVLIAVIIAYHKEIWSLITAFFGIFKDVFGGNFSFKRCDKSQNMLITLAVGLIPLLMVFVPVPGSGRNVFGIAREFWATDNMILLGISFLINSFLLKLGVDSFKSDKFKYTYKTADNMVKRWDGRMRLTLMDAVWCGVMQFTALIFPGISHIGAVFAIGIIRGINKKVSLNYSFLLGIPLIILKLVSEFLFFSKFTDIIHNVDATAVCVGILFAAIFGFLFIGIFNKMVQKNKIMIFSIYTVVLGIITLAIGIFERIYGIHIFQGTVL